MDVQARPRDAATRCPYCHDALTEGPDDRIECVGCGTSHHVACVAELGRCSVRGCERPFYVAEVERARAGGRRSPVVLAVSARIRDRVRSYVRAHARAPSSPDEARAAYDAAQAEAASAAAGGDQARAAEALRTAARALEVGRELDLEWAWQACDPDALRERARRLDERREAARALYHALQFAAVVVVATVVVGVVIALARPA